MFSFAEFHCGTTTDNYRQKQACAKLGWPELVEFFYSGMGGSSGLGATQPMAPMAAAAVANCYSNAPMSSYAPQPSSRNLLPGHRVAGKDPQRKSSPDYEKV
jgi:hypothetical protein